ncbi:MAG: HAD family hydrolase [Desulfarculus sp.]|jgi:HAD superfamily hydrolase (TIGR01509 family)|nr:MAG: HAD family hydrolase [Desulfarculus sp.]
MQQRPPTDLQGVIFDLDGVLFDSLDSNIAFYNHVLRALGLPPRAHEKAHIIHREAVQGSLRALVGEGELYDRALEYCRTMDLAPFIKDLKLYPGVMDTVQALRRAVRMAVATNRIITARQSLAHFGLLELFDEVVTPREAGGAPKPDPAMMYEVLKRLGLRAEQVVYVGDSSVDQGLCQAAGVRLVAFRNSELAAWAHLEHLTDLPALLGLA